MSRGLSWIGTREALLPIMQTWIIETWTHGNIVVQAKSKSGALKLAREIAKPMCAVLCLGTIRTDNVSHN